MNKERKTLERREQMIDLERLRCSASPSTGVLSSERSRGMERVGRAT